MLSEALAENGVEVSAVLVAIVVSDHLSGAIMRCVDFYKYRSVQIHIG